MTENFLEKISQLVDNELTTDDALLLLQKIQRQPESIEKMNRYQAINYAMRSKSFISIRSDFATRIQQEIKQDDLYNRPQTQVKSNLWNHNFMALAASLAIISVIMIHSTNTVVPWFSQISTSEKKTAVSVEKSDQRPLNAQINDYIQAQNKGGYSNNEAFIRLSSFNRN